uniref:Uncharacterized protein LOC109505333 n=1 Tax=Elaeis guineensis var. tenera TaxID=51953 RepID=A0A6J0PE43_ELAGV|nr:uncharacterized protein LOC109505333 [Elaeis guineensis]
MSSSDELPGILQVSAELALVRQLLRKAEVKALEAEANAARILAINADLLARNAHLELMNALMRRDKYGAKSERASRLIDQLEMAFEELEADASEAESLANQAAAKTTTIAAFTRKRGTRRDFPAGTPREDVVIPAPEQCPCCGSAELSHLPASITETLETVPARHKVIRTVREKVSCRQCETIRQPLNSQRDRLEAEGIPLSLSTLADQIGAVCAALRPIALLNEAHVLAAERLHADDTTVPLLAKYKTEIARIWDYVRDDRPFNGSGAPALMCRYSRNRKGEHPRAHLAGYTGILQVDRYAGFNQMFEPGWADKAMTRANCWAHGRRELFKLVDVAGQLKRKKEGSVPLISPLAREGLEMIDETSPPSGISLRQTLSRHDPVAKAIAYFLNDWEGFTSFLEDGRICLTNNAAERPLRSVARGRKAWLFVGSDRGGDRAAMLFSLIGTCRLNDVDPLAWLTDVLARIAEIPQTRLHELLPWNWKLLRNNDPAELAA